MTEQKLWKFLNRPASPLPFDPIHYTPILLSDSKGKYLKEFLVNSVVENRVQFWYKGSPTTRQTVDWLRDNIDRKIQRHGPLWIYIWVGTCDLTKKTVTTSILHLSLTIVQCHILLNTTNSLQIS
jgi:hypothetical protein